MDQHLQASNVLRPNLIVNKYSYPCAICKTKIQAGTGFAHKDSKKGWITLCNSSACIRAATGWDPSTAPAQEQEPSRAAMLLSVDGVDRIVIRTEYHPALIPLLKALPGARWHPDIRAWHCSPAQSDRIRVLELLDRMQVEVEESLRDVQLDPLVEQAMDRARRAGAYPYQIIGVRFLAMQQRALLGDDMGLGKTLQSLMAIPDQGRAMIIVPNSLKLNWKNECLRWRPDLKPVVCGQSDFHFPSVGEVSITNYESVRWIDTEKKKKKEGYIVEPKAKKGKDRAVLTDEMKECMSHTILIVDEAHRAKNYKSKQSEAISALSTASAKTWLLTGTPLLNRPQDLFGVMSAGGMAKSVFGGWSGFVASFRGMKNRFGGYEFGEPQPDVVEKIRRVMLRRNKGDVLDLPGKQYQTISCPISSASLSTELDVYYEMEGGEKLLSLPDFSEFSEIRARLARDRIGPMVELVESYEEAQTPIVVFSAHRDPIVHLEQREGWAAIYGDASLTSERRQDIVDRFQRGELKGIAMTIQAGGVGLTLTRASTVIFVDMDWNPGNNWQAEDRVCRIGQTASSIHIIRMVSDHPLDHHILKLLDVKQRLIETSVLNTLPQAPSPEARQNIPLAIRDESDEELQARLDKMIEAEKEAEALAKRDIARDKIDHRVSELASTGKLTIRPINQETRDEIESAIAALAAVCDGALTQDEVGFNKPDAAVGHWFAHAGMSNDADYCLALHILRKYVGQIGHRYPLIYTDKEDAD